MLELKRPQGFLSSQTWQNEILTHKESKLSVRDVRLGHIYKSNYTVEQQKPAFHTGVINCRVTTDVTKYRPSPYGNIPSLNRPNSTIVFEYGGLLHNQPSETGYVAKRNSAY